MRFCDWLATNDAVNLFDRSIRQSIDRSPVQIWYNSEWTNKLADSQLGLPRGTVSEN